MLKFYLPLKSSNQQSRSRADRAPARYLLANSRKQDKEKGIDGGGVCEKGGRARPEDPEAQLSVAVSYGSCSP